MGPLAIDFWLRGCRPPYARGYLSLHFHRSVIGTIFPPHFTVLLFSFTCYPYSTRVFTCPTDHPIDVENVFLPDLIFFFIVILGLCFVVVKVKGFIFIEKLFLLGFGRLLDAICYAGSPHINMFVPLWLLLIWANCSWCLFRLKDMTMSGESAQGHLSWLSLSDVVKAKEWTN